MYDLSHKREGTPGGPKIKQKLHFCYNLFCFPRSRVVALFQKWYYSDGLGLALRKVGKVANEDKRDLEILLSYLVNKQLKQAEVILALGISRSAYYDQKERGTLSSPNNLVCAAQYFGLNPLDLLVHYGYVTPAETQEYCGRSTRVDPPAAPTSKGGTVTRRRGSEGSPGRHLGSAI